VAIQIRSDGTFSIEYEGSYSGLNVQKPETLISDKASPSFNNFMLRNAEIRSRPALTQLYPGPSTWQLGISSFLDINGATHVVMWSGSNLYQFDPTLLPGNPWALVGLASPGDMGVNTVAYRSFANTMWYTNNAFISTRGTGGAGVINPFVGYWDGVSSAPVYTQTFGDASTSDSVAGISLTDSPTVGGSLPGGPTVTGPLAIGANYLGELNNYLILANVSVKDQGTGIIRSYPNLIWWSANGLPLQWDPTQNTSAGFNPFLDVSDAITGLATLGIAGYIFRTNGISQFSPTGSAIAPWEFDHLWASDHGIGNVLPWSIAQYGPNVAFVSTDNIYTLSVTNSQPIGGDARDAIFADIATAPWSPFACIAPYFKSGYVYLTYQIYIPFNNYVRLYVYAFEDQNWSTWDLGIIGNPPFQSMTCQPNVV